MTITFSLCINDTLMIAVQQSTDRIVAFQYADQQAHHHPVHDLRYLLHHHYIIECIAASPYYDTMLDVWHICLSS